MIDLYFIGWFSGVLLGYVLGFFMARMIYRSPTWPKMHQVAVSPLVPTERSDFNAEAETLGLPVNYALDLKQSTSISWPPHKTS